MHLSYLRRAPVTIAETLSRFLTPGMLSHSSGVIQVGGCHIYLRSRSPLLPVVMASALSHLFFRFSLVSVSSCQQLAW